MSKVWKVILSLVIVVILISLGFYLIGYLKPKGAGIFIDKTPLSDIYIDGALVGGASIKADVFGRMVSLAAMH